jgi:hypothetical protein
MLLLRFANDEGLAVEDRIKAAIGAAPYCHSRMSTINMHHTATEAPSSAVIEKLRDLMTRATSNPVIDVTPAREGETKVVELPKRAP